MKVKFRRISFNEWVRQDSSLKIASKKTCREVVCYSQSSALLSTVYFWEVVLLIETVARGNGGRKRQTEISFHNQQAPPPDKVENIEKLKWIDTHVFRARTHKAERKSVSYCKSVSLFAILPFQLDFTRPARILVRVEISPLPIKILDTTTMVNIRV